MKSSQQIQNKIEETLQSLEGVQRASANPYLFTRIQARLQNSQDKRWQQIVAVISRPSVAVAGLVLILLLNGAVVFNQEKSTAVNNVTVAGQSGEQTFADEYSLAVNTVYDYANSEP